MRAPLVTGGLDYHGVTETVCRVAEQPSMPRAWYIALGLTSTLLAVVLLGADGVVVTPPVIVVVVVAFVVTGLLPEPTGHQPVRAPVSSPA